jgi:CRP-like cAMP-binding protein
MKNTLVEMMSNFIELTDDEKQGILEAFPIKAYTKGTHLLSEGQISKDAFFVIKGCLRKHHIEGGDEKTSEFYTEF